MTLISALATEAFREGNLIAVNTSPTTDEQAEAETLLNRYIQSLFGNEAGEQLEPLSLGKNGLETPDLIPVYMDDMLQYFVPSNASLYCNLEQEVTVNLDPIPSNGQRIAVNDVSGNFATHNLILEGNGRKIESGTSVTLDTNGLIREWFYRADLGEWVRLTSLTGSDSSPFPEVFDDLIIIGTAIRLNPRHGVQMDPLTAEYFRGLKTKFQNTYRQTREVGSELGIVRLNPNVRWNGYGSTTAFNKGRFGW